MIYNFLFPKICLDSQHAPTYWEPESCVPDVVIEHVTGDSRLHCTIKVLCVYRNDLCHLSKIQTQTTLER